MDNIHPFPLGPARAPARVAPDSQRPAPVSFVDQIEARYRQDLPDLFEALRENARREPTWGEKLVEFFRRSSFACGIALYVLAVAVGMYFAFQLGRGVL